MIKNNHTTYYILRPTPESGFIALMSTIIISAVLLIITVSLNLTGFLGRFNIFDSELKEVSLNLAEACGDTALLNLANAVTYLGDVSVGSDKCTIVSVQGDTPSAGKTTVKTTAMPANSRVVTNIEIVIDSISLEVITWKEVPGP